MIWVQVGASITARGEPGGATYSGLALCLCCVLREFSDVLTAFDVMTDGVATTAMSWYSRSRRRSMKTQRVLQSTAAEGLSDTSWTRTAVLPNVSFPRRLQSAQLLHLQSAQLLHLPLRTSLVSCPLRPSVRLDSSKDPSRITRHYP